MPTVKMLGPRFELLPCSTVSSVSASGTWVASAIAVSTTSISLDTCSGRIITPSSNSQASAKYTAKIQATSSKVLTLGLAPKMTSAIEGTQINTKNSTTTKLRRE